nr:1370_t:CDS:2 [Entrophospora candida]
MSTTSGNPGNISTKWHVQSNTSLMLKSSRSSPKNSIDHKPDKFAPVDPTSTAFAHSTVSIFILDGSLNLIFISLFSLISCPTSTAA